MFAMLERVSPFRTVYTLIWLESTFSCAVSPIGFESEASAEPSTIVMSPPPLAGLGSIFAAGWRRGTVWELRLVEDALEIEADLSKSEPIKLVKLA
jgi:hypothetical protein